MQEKDNKGILKRNNLLALISQHFDPGREQWLKILKRRFY